RGCNVHCSWTIEDRAIAFTRILELPAGNRVEDRVVTRPIAALAALAIGAGIVERDIGLGSADGLFTEAQFGSALEAHIVMNDFRPLDQPFENWPRFRPCEVDREAPLRTRRRLIIAMHEPDAVARQRLDLDDVGAHVAHHGRP